MSNVIQRLRKCSKWRHPPDRPPPAPHGQVDGDKEHQVTFQLNKNLARFLRSIRAGDGIPVIPALLADCDCMAAMGRLRDGGRPFRQKHGRCCGRLTMIAVLDDVYRAACDSDDRD